jgi:uncharacterized membrane protein YoaK (UPF0700 family)
VSGIEIQKAVKLSKQQNHEMLMMRAMAAHEHCAREREQHANRSRRLVCSCLSALVAAIIAIIHGSSRKTTDQLTPGDK